MDISTCSHPYSLVFVKKTFWFLIYFKVCKICKLQVVLYPWFHSDPKERLPHSELSYKCAFLTVLRSADTSYYLWTQWLLAAGIFLSFSELGPRFHMFWLAPLKVLGLAAVKVVCSVWTRAVRLHLPTHTEETHNSLIEALRRHDAALLQTLQ